MRLDSLAILFAASGILLLSSVSLVVPTALAENSPGKEVFERRCTGCHALDHEKTGPRLHGVFGRTAGKVPSFAYSESLRKSGVAWDAVTLDKWLTDPDAFIPDNDMAFRVPNKEERATIIGYLKDVSPK